jgi:DNA-binding beta-propeller fold protein YncE
VRDPYTKVRALWLVWGLALLAGCGQRYELPAQPEPGRIPTPGKYNLDKTWNLDAAPTDMVSQGSYLYVIEDSARVASYLTRSKEAHHPQFVGEFQGLIRPVQLALARRDSTFLIVADAGDTTIKRFLFTGGSPLFTFTDSIWRGDFTGIAADSRLNIYVACAHSDSILKYDAQGARVRLISNTGTGSGYVQRPSGLHCTASDLLAADTGNSLIKRIRTDTTCVAAGPPLGESIVSGPCDAVADPADEVVFVADTGHDRVLKFLKTGALVDSVYSPTKAETMLTPPLRRPRFVAVQDSLVFVSDPENKRIVAFRLATL